MSKFAIVKINNSQFKVFEGDVISVDRLEDVKDGDNVTYDEVLLIGQKDDVVIGKPFIDKAKVIAEVIENHRGPKVQSSTYKAKSRQRRKVGSRSHLTKIKILKIN